uniref:Uncharacterized protein n=1 Tax=Picea sitchensis TaxID=3332 RepID=D5AB27_PICSI|nr:unknown [Picea sitchensis]
MLRVVSRVYLITGLSRACQILVTIWYCKTSSQFVIFTYFVVLTCNKEIGFDFLNFCNGKISFLQMLCQLLLCWLLLVVSSAICLQFWVMTFQIELPLENF